MSFILINIQHLTSLTANHRRKIRLSLVESAQVFTPCPSPHPPENLRTLQSPLKRSPTKSNLSQVHASADEDDDEEIVLVEGSTPQVAQENDDLVILEEVERMPPPRSPIKPRTVFPFVQRSPNKNEVVQTPPRRNPRPSLHRHVLIKSAQRAVFQQEDEEEMEEVLGAITTNVSSSESEDGGEHSEEEEEAKMEIDDDYNDEKIELEAQPDVSASKSSWSQTFVGRIWPFSRASIEVTFMAFFLRIALT